MKRLILATFVVALGFVSQAFAFCDQHAGTNRDYEFYFDGTNLNRCDSSDNWVSVATGGLGDRITSSTTSVVANSGGVVSVTINSTPVANFGSGGLGITNINASGAISATGTGYFGGNVGIGTAVPSTTLNLYNSNSNLPILTIGGAGGAGNTVGLNISPWQGRPGGAPTAIYGVDDGFYSAHLTFSTAQTASTTTVLSERMRITSGGNVGIGTVSPTTKLEVVGTVSATNLQAAGTIKVGAYSSAPIACGATYKGMMAMTHLGHICACDGSSWNDVGNNYAACSW
jgi:hypothetical protein